MGALKVVFVVELYIYHSWPNWPNEGQHLFFLSYIIEQTWLTFPSS